MDTVLIAELPYGTIVTLTKKMYLVVFNEKGEGKRGLVSLRDFRHTFPAYAGMKGIPIRKLTKHGNLMPWDRYKKIARQCK